METGVLKLLINSLARLGQKDLMFFKNSPHKELSTREETLVTL